MLLLLLGSAARQPTPLPALPTGERRKPPKPSVYPDDDVAIALSLAL